ncbi:MAG: hypothetical protein ACYDAG_08075 [Chloroflexota bacterium]
MSYSLVTESGMEYQLIDLNGGRPLGFYDNMDDGLHAVVEEIELNGVESVETLALGWGSLVDKGGVIAEGRELADRALARFPTPGLRSA